jgi:hypothetical protein
MSTPLEELERLKEQAGDLSDIRRGSPRFKEREGYWREFQFVEALVRHADWLLTQAREAAELRETKQWFDQQLDDIRFYSGTSSATWKRLVEQLKERFDSARKEG